MANSLDRIKEILKAPKKPYNELPVHEHEALGKVYIGKLSTAGYGEVEAPDYPTQDVLKWPVAARIKWQEENKFRAYLKYCVYLDDGSRLDSDSIELLLKGDYGAENKKLINAIRKENPPREHLVEEIQVILSYCSWITVMLRAAVDGGLMGHVNQYLSLDNDDPKIKQSAEVLAELETALPVWEAFFKTGELKEKEAKEVEDSVDQQV